MQSSLERVRLKPGLIPHLPARHNTAAWLWNTRPCLLRACGQARGLPARAGVKLLAARAAVAVAAVMHVQRGVQAQASCRSSRIQILQERLRFGDGGNA